MVSNWQQELSIKMITDDLKKIRNDRYIHYLSLRPSANTNQNDNNQHMINSDYQNFQSPYEREDFTHLELTNKYKTKNQSQ